MTVHALSIHADYTCRHSGACCTAGWRIPFEPHRACTVAAAVTSRGSGAGSPPFERRGEVIVARLARDGACVFFERGEGGRNHRCAIHNVVGHDALPVACRQFPRVALMDARGVFITLSHFCPTAAAMLFRDDVALRIIESPAAFPEEDYEGLDARDAWPPLLRPGMLMDLEAYAAWEQHAVALFADERRTVSSALEQLTLDVEAIRRWRPGDGTLIGAIAQLDRRAKLQVGRGGQAAGRAVADTLEPYSGIGRATVLVCVPDDLRPAVTATSNAEVGVLHPPLSPDLDRALRRYLAAKVFASWMAYQGHGLRTIVASLHAALDLVRAEADRQCTDAGRPLDRELLIAAIREADLLLVHKASREALARRLSRVEGQ